MTVSSKTSVLLWSYHAPLPTTLMGECFDGDGDGDGDEVCKSLKKCVYNHSVHLALTQFDYRPNRKEMKSLTLVPSFQKLGASNCLCASIFHEHELVSVLLGLFWASTNFS